MSNAKRKVSGAKKESQPKSGYSDKVKKLADRIRTLRKESGYESALKFAIDKEISTTQMARWERGRNITFESLCKLADAFEITLSELMKGIN